jgi:hypothetical protein
MATTAPLVRDGGLEPARMKLLICRENFCQRLPLV